MIAEEVINSTNADSPLRTKKPVKIDTKLAQKQGSVYSKSNEENSSQKMGSSEIKTDHQVSVSKSSMVVPGTPEVISTKFLLNRNDSSKHSHEDTKSDIEKVKKFRSEKPIKDLLKYDTNSSAINLLSPHNSSNFVKSKRKTSDARHQLHHDGASIVSANLSSEMGTA